MHTNKTIQRWQKAPRLVEFLPETIFLTLIVTTLAIGSKNLANDTGQMQIATQSDISQNAKQISQTATTTLE